jgi:adenylate cyclase
MGCSILEMLGECLNHDHDLAILRARVLEHTKQSSDRATSEASVALTDQCRVEREKEVVDMAQRPVEVERKWLVDTPLDLPAHQGKHVIQGYIAVADDGTEVRLRQIGEQYFQTVKSQGGLVRGEIEVELSRQQFETLWPATAGRRLEKTRYQLPWGGKTVEVDVYHGSLAGLVVVEVEFSSTSESTQFVPPAWFGREVTEDNSYKNVNLVQQGAPGGV